VELLYRTKFISEKGLNSYPQIPTDSDEYTITIPKLNIYNLNVSFADPYDHDGSLSVLKDGLGHYLSPPGSGHKMVLFGHSSGYSWDHSPYKTILTQINRLELGDMIYVNYREKGYIYQVVRSEIRPANDMNPVMQDLDTEELALYTCWPPNGISKRYVIYADPLL
jgi:LPXTG-site transpeptidase (sortase) family protein